LIDEQGNNLGTTETSKALKMARERGLDLIEIAPNAKPPVCRIMDYGKYKYQKSKKEKTQRIKQKNDELKGIRISFRTGQHDLEIKAKRAEKFLEQGHKVKIEMILRGREKSFSLAELAKEKFNQFIESINLEIKIEQEIKKQPRGLLMIISKSQK
jgi:translation initiation factor IF-3